MIANHISSRVPGEDGAFLINAYGMLYEEITASQPDQDRYDGNILARPDFGDLDYGINKGGLRDPRRRPPAPGTTWIA